MPVFRSLVKSAFQLLFYLCIVHQNIGHLHEGWSDNGLSDGFQDGFDGSDGDGFVGFGWNRFRGDFGRSKDGFVTSGFRDGFGEFQDRFAPSGFRDNFDSYHRHGFFFNNAVRIPYNPLYNLIYRTGCPRCPSCPTCGSCRCPRPSKYCTDSCEVENGSVSITANIVGSVAVITCNEGYNLNGVDAKCVCSDRLGGTWIGPTRCVPDDEC